MSQGEYKFPLEERSKTYKTEGWLKRHISACHPQLDQLHQPISSKKYETETTKEYKYQRESKIRHQQ